MGVLTDFTGLCALCNAPATETHHLVYGRGIRELAEADGLTLPLCHDCHRDIHNNGTAGRLSKRLGQIAFEKQKIIEGVAPESVRAVFMERYGRSYL